MLLGAARDHVEKCSRARAPIYGSEKNRKPLPEPPPVSARGGFRESHPRRRFKLRERRARGIISERINSPISAIMSGRANFHLSATLALVSFNGEKVEDRGAAVSFRVRSLVRAFARFRCNLVQDFF